MRLALSVCILAVLGTFAWGQAPDQTRMTRTLESFEGDLVGWQGTPAIVQDETKGRVLEWRVPPGEEPRSLQFDFSDRNIEMDDWEEILFDYRLAPVPDWWGIKLVDAPLADGHQATWRVDSKTIRAGQWQTARFPLHSPQWRWGNPGTSGQLIFFRMENKGDAEVVVRLNNLRVERARFGLRRVEDTSNPPAQEGRPCVSFRVTNFGDEPGRVRLRSTPLSSFVTLTDPESVLSVGVGESVVRDLLFTVDPKTPPFTHLEYRVELLPEDAGQTDPIQSVEGELRGPDLQVPHPCLLFTREQLPGIKARIETWEGGKSWWQGMLARADSWLARTPEFPERGSQWWHWYTCKKCGTSLKTQSPTLHVCPNCGAEYSGYPYDDVVLSSAHSNLARAIRDLGAVHLITGDPRYAAKAREILFGYAERYLQYPLHDIHGKPTKGGGHVSPQTLDEAVWLIEVARGYDAIRETLSEEDRRTITDKLLLPAAHHIKNHQWGIHNICCWHASAYGLVGLALDDPELATAAINGPKGFRAQTAKGITDDGQWYERSWGYHFYTMHALEPLAIACRNLGVDVFTERYKSLYDAPLRFVTPTHQLPAFNDSARTAFDGARMAPLYEPAYAWWDDPLHGFLVGQGKRTSMAAVLWGADEIRPGQVSFRSGAYPDAGVLVLRSDPPGTPPADMPRNYLALDFGEHGGGHGHPDKLNIVLWGHGELLAEDPGCIAYGNPAHPGYYRQTLSHNTLVVDGRSQNPTAGELLFSVLDDDAGFACARATAAYPGIELGRAVALVDDVVLDLYWAGGSGEHRYDWCFHSRGALTFSAPGEPADPGEGDGYSWVKDWRRAECDGVWNASWRLEKGPGLQLVQATAKGELWNGIGMGNPATVKVPLVISRTRGAQTLYATAMRFVDTDNQDTMTVQPLEVGAVGGAPAYGLQATVGDTEYLMVVLPEGGAANVAGTAIEGQGALLVRRDGRTVRTLLH